MGAAGQISQEIEIKLQLGSFMDYLKLVGFLGQVEQEERHVTGFFDTEDRRLAAEGWALRIRAEDSRGLITVKSETTQPGVASVRDEVESEITRGEALDILGLRKDVLSMSNDAVGFVREKLGKASVSKLVHFENIRQKKPFKIGDYDYVLEIDKTEFADGSVDYELELELPDQSRIEVVEHRLRNLFSSLGIPFEIQTESKLARALRRAGMA